MAFFLFYFASGKARRLAPSTSLPAQSNQLKLFQNGTNHRIEILGNVGNVYLSSFEDGGRSARVSVATNLVHNTKDNGAVVETTWHNVVVRPNRFIKAEDLDLIKKGAPIRVLGRMKNTKFTGADGVERTGSDIIAAKVEFVETTGESLQPAML